MIVCQNLTDLQFFGHNASSYPKIILETIKTSFASYSMGVADFAKVQGHVRFEIPRT